MSTSEDQTAAFRDVIEQLVPYFADRHGITLTAPAVSWTRGGYQAAKSLYRPGERVIRVREEFSYSRPEIVSRVAYHLGEQAVDENTPLQSWEADETDDKLVFELTNEVAREFQIEGLGFVRRGNHALSRRDRLSFLVRELQNRIARCLASVGPPIIGHRRPLRANNVDIDEFFARPRSVYMDLLKEGSGRRSLLSLSVPYVEFEGVTGLGGVAH